MPCVTQTTEVFRMTDCSCINCTAAVNGWCACATRKVLITWQVL